MQEDLRVFPVSDDGYDIVDVFERIFAKNRDRVTLHYSEGVSDVSFLSSVPVIARHEAIQVSEFSVIPGLTRDPVNNNESLYAGSPHARG